MAEEITCPVCQTLNDPSNETCIDCGAPLHEEAPVEAVPDEFGAAVDEPLEAGDDFIEPVEDGDPGGFEGVEEVQAYDQENPDYGVDEELVAGGDADDLEEGTAEVEDILEGYDGDDEELADVPVEEGVEFGEEDFAADELPVEPLGQPGDVEAGESPSEQLAPHEETDEDVESIEFELEPIDEDEQFGDEPDTQFDGGQPFGDDADALTEGYAADADQFEEFGATDSFDEIPPAAAAEAADEVEEEFEGFGDAEEGFEDFGDAEEGFEDFGDQDEGIEGFGDEDESLQTDQEAAFDEGFDTDEHAAVGDEWSGEASDAEFDEDSFGEEGSFAVDEEAFGEASEVEPDEEEEQAPPPPELDAIMNPEPRDRPSVEPLPEPGPYAEPATLAIFKAGEQLGEVAIDFDCTVLGLDRPEPADAEEFDSEAVEPVVDEEAVEELDDIEPVAFEDEEPADDAFEIEPVDAEPLEAELEVEPLEAELDEESHEDEGFDFGSEPVEEEAEGTEEDVELVEETTESATEHEEPEDVEEGPVIDLSQFGDEEAFATRHGYVFRQNKNYTLYVTSDAGTQLNDELLSLGEHRELADGDVIVLGGEVALQFKEPAA